jgi:hypothetical protein
MVGIEAVASEASYRVAVACQAELDSMRAAIAILAQIERESSAALLDVPSAAELLPGIAQARMEAVAALMCQVGPTASNRLAA